MQIVATHGVGFTLPNTAPSDPIGKYSFIGWKSSDDNETYQPKTPFTTNNALVFTAQWKINKYTVTFQDYDNTVLQKGQVAHEADATAPSGKTGSTCTSISLIR